MTKLATVVERLVTADLLAGRVGSPTPTPDDARYGPGPRQRMVAGRLRRLAMSVSP
jgi:hypothetical protein